MATYEELDIEVRGNSKQQKTKCPLCAHTRKNKTDKSLSVNLNTGAYHCFNCGWKGIVDGKTAEETKQERRDYYKQQKEYAKPNIVQLPLGDKVIKWFTDERHITRETLQYFKVTESQDWMPERNGHAAGTRTCINFNYYRNKQLVNVKYRDSLKCFRLVKDAELIFYNLDSLQDRTEVLICEGEIDAMTYYQSGYYGPVSVPNGASKGSARLEYLDNCSEEFDRMTKIIIATDGDEAGESLRVELTRRLGSHRCWFIEYPAGCKDANEVLVKYGNDEVRKLWLNATAPPIEHVITVEDVESELDDIYANGWPKIEPIGYLQFDRLLNFAPGEVTTVSGIPQHGKDSFIRQILIRKAVRYGERSFIFNHEEKAAYQLIKAAQQFIGKPFYRSNHNDKMNAAQYSVAKKFLQNHIYILDIASADLTIDGILRKSAELVLRKGVKYIAIGPYNCIEAKREAWQTEGEYVSMIYQKLTRFADQYKVHVFFVAHTTKMSKNNGVFEIPNLYSIAGSANFFNKTHNGITVYRNYSHNTSDVHVQKVKYFFNGELGCQAFDFDVNTTRYAEEGSPFESELDYLIAKQQQTQMQFSEPQPTPAVPVEPVNPVISKADTSDFNNWAGPLPDAPF